MMAQLIRPPRNTIFQSTSQTFEWTSADGSYCYQSYIEIYNIFGDLLIDSGTINPGNGNSVFDAVGLPSDGQPIQALISCNPQNIGFFNFTATGGQPSGGSTQGGTTGGGTSGGTAGGNTTSSGAVTGEVTLAAGSTIVLDSGITEEQRVQFVEGTMAMFAAAVGVVFILKAMR